MTSLIWRLARSASASLGDLCAGANTSARELMARSRRYHFRSQWRVRSSVDDVARVFMDSHSLSRWWPQFLESNVDLSGDAVGRGRVFRVVTKGWLPYKLRFQLHVTDVQFPNYFRVETTGDFDGVGAGVLQQNDELVNVQWDWQLTVRKPLLHASSPLLRRLLETNHYWVMRRGERRLQQLLAR